MQAYPQKLEGAVDIHIFISENVSPMEIPTDPQTIDGLALYTITDETNN